MMYITHEPEKSVLHLYVDKRVFHYYYYPPLTTSVYQAWESSLALHYKEDELIHLQALLHDRLREVIK